MLQAGVIAEFKAQQQHVLCLISEYRVNNEYMFTEKSEALEAQKKIQVQNAQPVVAVAEAYRIVPELHILQEVLLEVNIRKVAPSMRDAKTEAAIV